MLGEIFRFLLEIVFTLFGAALLLRAWMHAVQLHPLNPLARAIHQTTDWLVLPLRRLVSARANVDWSSLVAVWLTSLIYLALISLAARGSWVPIEALPRLALGALIMVLKWALNLVVWLTLIQAVLSWVNPMAPLMPLLQMLTAPLLEPLRRVLPRGGIDFSPLVVLIVVQVLLMMLTRATYALILP
jgi:YggT family protein